MVESSVELSVETSLCSSSMSDGDERCFPNNFPPLEEPHYSLPPELAEQLAASISDQLVYISSPSSYSALLGVAAASVSPKDDGTIYTGSGGLALLFIRLGQHTQAEKYLERSLYNVSQARVTFLCGSPGPLTLLAVLRHRQGAAPDLSQILSLASQVTDLSSGLPDELLYGRAGYLHCLLYLRQELGDAAVPTIIIRKVVEAILRSGAAMSRATKSRSPLMFAWHDKVYIGAAHGLAGILVTLLAARYCVTPAEMSEWVQPSVDYVLNMQMESGNFPSSKGSVVTSLSPPRSDPRSLSGNDKDRLVHWCHGAPGVCHLMLAAHKVSHPPITYSGADSRGQVWGGDTDKYLVAARSGGELVWQRGLIKKGPGLCHGVAGNGYTFLHLYQVGSTL